MTETEIPTEAFVTGKRKTAIARVRMRLGTGQILVNGRPADEYFPREALVGLVNQPIEVASVSGRYDVIATVKGCARAPVPVSSVSQRSRLFWAWSSSKMIPLGFRPCLVGTSLESGR